MLNWLFGRKTEPPEEIQREELGPDTHSVPSILTTLLASQVLPIDTENLESQLESIHQQVATLMDQARVLQDQLDRLDRRAAFGNDQLETLTQHLADVAGWAGPLDRRLAELVTWAEQSREEMAQLQGSIDKLSHTQIEANSLAEAQQERLQSALEALQAGIAGWADPLDQRLAELVTWGEQSREELARLEDGLRRIGRTQFKTNSLAEAQQERLQAALETLQDLATRKQEAIEKEWQARQQAAKAAELEARVAMAVDLFPALDGLESALESGRALLGGDQPSAVRPGFLARLSYALGLRDLPTPGSDTHALEAWLEGLELVRERFLAMLQAEGIQPIRAAGEPFDPHLHVAVEAVEQPGVPPGTVIEEHRPGYRQGDRILRFAEVVVARDSARERYPSSPVSGVEAHEGPDQLLDGRTGELETAASASDRWDAESVATVKEEPGSFDQTTQLEVMNETEALEGSEEPSVQDPAEVESVPEQRRESADFPPDATAEGAAPGEAPKSEGDTSSSDTQDTTGEVDPEIEEMIARFEARQRARHS